MSSVGVGAETGFSPRNIAESEVPVGVRLSADAKKLLYHLKPLYTPDGGSTSAIWLADVDNENGAKQFTSGLYNDYAAQFHPDGEQIIFLSDRHAKGGPAQLYSISLSGGEAYPLLPVEKKVKNGISSFEVSPDGRYIAFTSRDDPTSEDERRMNDKDDARVFGDKRSLDHLRLFTFATGSVRTFEQPFDKHVPYFTWASDSKSILFITRKQAEPEFIDFEVELFSVSLAPETGTLKLVATYPREPKTVIQVGNNSIVDIQKHEPSFHIDSRSVFVHSASNFSNAERLYGYTDDANWIISLGHDNKLAAMVATKLDTKIEVFDPSHAVGNSRTLVYETSDEAIEISFDAHAWDMRARDDGTLVLAVVKSSATRREPLNVWVGTLNANDGSQFALKQVSSHLQWLKDAPLCRAEAFHWKAQDGTDLNGVIYYPPGKKEESGPFPTILQMHGGPYWRTTLSYGPLFAGWEFVLASRGYLVICPNYRGGQGHGSAFARYATNGAGSKDWEDSESMVKAVIGQGLADPGRLGIGGWSYGGFLTAWGIGQTKKRFKAGIVGAGIVDWNNLAAESIFPDVLGEIAGAVPWDSGEDRKKLKGNPIWHVNDIETAVLVLHGENDVVVPVSQGVSYFRGLRRRSKYPERAQLVTYPREPHTFVERKHVEDLLKRVIEHYDLWMK